MPFDIGESINKLTDFFLKAPILNTVAKNPIYTSFAIVFIIMLIVMFVFRDADTEDPLLIMCLRTGFWVFIFTLGIMLIHNKILMNETITVDKNAAYDGLFAQETTPAVIGRGEPVTLEGSAIPIRINTCDFD